MAENLDLFPDLPAKEPAKRSSRCKPLTDPPEDLTAEDKKALGAWCAEKFPQYRYRKVGGIRDLVDDCLDWHREQKGRKRQKRNWRIACQRWIRKQAKMDYDFACKYPSEKPQYNVRSRSDKGFEKLADVIDLNRNLPKSDPE